jgi:hypothetical protein
MINEGNRIYKDIDRVDDWIMFHDGLTYYWTPESQECIKSKGLYDRQFRCLGDTNKANRYWMKVCGDSPVWKCTFFSHHENKIMKSFRKMLTEGKRLLI